MARTAKKQKVVGYDSLGEALHVALRKGCDSHPTSAAYNAIKLMPYTIWKEYLDAVWIVVGTVENRKAAVDALRAGSESYANNMGSFFVAERDMDHTKPGSLREFINKLPAKETVGRSIEEILRERDLWRYLWRSILDTFTDDDWKGFACFLVAGE